MAENSGDAGQPGKSGLNECCASDVGNETQGKAICCDNKGDEKSKIGFDGNRNDGHADVLKVDGQQTEYARDCKQNGSYCGGDETKKPNMERGVLPKTNNCQEGSFGQQREIGASALRVRYRKPDQDAVDNTRIKELCRVFEPKKDIVGPIICETAEVKNLDVKRLEKQDRNNDNRDKIQELCKIFDNQHTGRVVATKENVGLRKGKEDPYWQQKVREVCEKLEPVKDIGCAFVCDCFYRSCDWMKKTLTLGNISKFSVDAKRKMINNFNKVKTSTQAQAISNYLGITFELLVIATFIFICVLCVTLFYIF